MSPDTVPPALREHRLAGVLADPRRMRVLAAVALGAGTDAEIAAAAGLSPREVLGARRRLEEAGLVTPSARAEVAYPALVALAREQAGPGPAPGPERDLAAFLSEGRLRTLPAQPGRRRTVLAHVAGRAFGPGRTYDEAEVNALLRPWCEGGPVDHAALRRYLVEEGLLARRDGAYWVPTAERAPAPGAAERAVQALGLA